MENRKSMKDTMISFFLNVKSTVPQEVSLYEFITTSIGKEKVEQLRKIEDKALRSYNKKNFPAATLSGLFSKRNFKYWIYLFELILVISSL